MTGTSARPHRHVEVLRMVYADLTAVARFATEDIVLHRAHRTAAIPGTCRGIQAVLAHEQKLVELTKGTLIMNVEHITANEYFGAVLGTLRTRHPRVITMPFCGLWRFADGKIAEHWENAYNPAELHQLLTSAVPGARGL